MSAIEPLERTLDLPRMVAYAGATWDWHRLHYDSEFIARMKVPAPVVDGQMLGALLAEMLLEHFGARAFIRRLSITYKAMVFAGETVRCEGTVTAHEGDEVLADLVVHAGDKIAATGHAAVRVDDPRDDEDEGD